MRPLVSILIPAFNSESWIAESIKSAIEQTWERKEIIVVDDGSSDGTLAAARRFESENVMVVTQENQGAASARNRAVELSRGNYIQWLDADDVLAPDKIAIQMELSAKNGSERSLYSSEWAEFSYRTDRAQFCPNSLWRDLSPVEWLLRKLGENIFMQTGCWLVSRALTDAAGPWDGRLTTDDDGEYFSRVIGASDRIRFVSGSRVFYRMVSSNRLSYIGVSTAKQDSQFLSMQLQLANIRTLENSDRVRVASLQYLEHLLVVFYPERPEIVRQLEKMAEELGARLSPPKLRRKYAWMRPLVGWSGAKRAQLVLPRVRDRIERCFHRVLPEMERRGDGSQADCHPGSRESD
jgi:glycosyltransferase involved in cell wall biosynthesis